MTSHVATRTDRMTGDMWHIDHCHKTGVVRGLLCDKCNKGVGLFDDDVDKLAGMIEYLMRERAT